MLKLFKIISLVMIPSTFLFFGIRYLSADREYQHIFILPFLASIATYYLLKSYWNQNIDPKYYDEFKKTKIKVPSIKRAILLFYAIQFFWITYWANNWLILIVILLVIFYYECHYSIYSENIMVSHSEYIDQTGKINIKTDPRILEQIIDIQSTSNIFAKIKLIHFDLYAVIPTSNINLPTRLFRCVWLLLFFIGITFNFDQYILPTPLSHFSILQYNKRSQFPKLEEAIIFENVPFKVSSIFLSGNGSTSGYYSIEVTHSTNKKYSISGLRFNKIYDYRTRSGYATIWIDSKTNKIIQFKQNLSQLDTINNHKGEDYKPLEISYQESLNAWINHEGKKKNLSEFYQNFVLYICLIGFFLSIINDYFYYFYLRKIYYGSNTA